MELAEKIQQLVLEKIEADEAYVGCFVLEVALRSGNRLEVILDSDTGITFQMCQVLSRHLEKELDEHGWLGEKYVLEVGSAGITRPLELPRQYIKNIGRFIKLQLKDSSEAIGEITAADDAGVTISFEQITREGKKKIKEILTPKYPYETIKKAVIQVKF
jgi:ribosome maturation factor RimP